MEGNVESLAGTPQSVRERQGITPLARELAQRVCALLGPTTLGALHYGSRAQGRDTSPDSAYDYFVVVGSYREAYRELAAEMQGFRRRTANVLAWILPPNAVSIRPEGQEGPEAKCIVLSLRHLRREASARARDHFVRARLSQLIHLAWCRDAEAAAELRACLGQVRRGTFEWVRGSLPLRFDAEAYCLTMLKVAFASEIRLEPGDHVETLFAAQRTTMLGEYGRMLEGLVEEGILARDGAEFRQVRTVGAFTRLRTAVYFRTSKLRSTLRLLKHPFLYADWLDYLLHKVERSTGKPVQLRERERRRPLIYLWPRALRYFRDRSRDRR